MYLTVKYPGGWLLESAGLQFDLMHSELTDSRHYPCLSTLHYTSARHDLIAIADVDHSEPSIQAYPRICNVFIAWSRVFG